MIQALAPRMPRGFSWVCLAIVAIAWAPSMTRAQTPDKPPGTDKPATDPAKAAEKSDKDKAKDEPIEERPTTEVFTDPNAKKTLTIFSPMNYAGPAIKVGNPPDDRSRVQSMATGIVNTDPEFLKRYVEYFATELTRRDYLNALLNPPANAKPTDPAARGLERAVDALTKPILDARATNKSEFLTAYTRILFESSLPKILENNYLSRIDAMIVLGMAGGTSSQALDVYVKELKKPDQVIWVKLWAARGLSNAAQNGKVDLDALRSIQAAEALVGFLEGNPKLPWPAQMRVLEALGSIRISMANLPRGKLDVASVVMKVLADPDSNFEVRSWAAWALGMMKVSPTVAPFNFGLIGEEVGQLAVEIGDQIVKEFDVNQANFERQKIQAEHLTSILLFQVYPAIIGEDGARDSGLIHSPHPNFGTSKIYLTKLDGLVKGIARGSYELIRAGGAAAKDRRNELDAKLAELKKFLAQGGPKDRRLVPGGPEFAPVAGQQVAGAPGP